MAQIFDDCRRLVRGRDVETGFHHIEQKIDIEGFVNGPDDQVRVEGPGLHSRGQGEHAWAGHDRLPLEMLEQFVAAHARHHQIEHDQRVAVRNHLLERFDAVSRRVYGEAPFAQNGPEQRSDCVVVVDDQDSFFQSHFCGGPHGAKRLFGEQSARRYLMIFEIARNSSVPAEPSSSKSAISVELNFAPSAINR